MKIKNGQKNILMLVCKQKQTNSKKHYLSSDFPLKGNTCMCCNIYTSNFPLSDVAALTNKWGIKIIIRAWSWFSIFFLTLIWMIRPSYIVPATSRCLNWLFWRQCLSVTEKRRCFWWDKLSRSFFSCLSFLRFEFLFSSFPAPYQFPHQCDYIHLHQFSLPFTKYINYC